MAAAKTRKRGPGGRPKKAVHDRRVVSMRADATLSEKQFVRDQSKLAGISEADFIRRRVLGQPLVVRESRTDARLIHELNAIGVNLNQIARNLNSDRQGARAVDLDELGRLLRKTLHKALDALDD